MLAVEVDDRLLLPVFEPVVPRDLAVVLVGLAVALPPLVELALAGAQPADDAREGDLGLLRPVLGEVDDRVASVVGDPAALQISPRSFFNATCSSMSSARTSSFFASLRSSAAIRSSLSSIPRFSRPFDSNA